MSSSLEDTCPRTIVLTDSRGKGFSNFISNYSTIKNLNCEIDIQVHPGFTVEQIAQIIEGVHQDYDYIVVCAGICNFTSKITIDGKKSLTYPTDALSRKHIVDYTCDTLQQLKADFGKYINICTIPHASLSGYIVTANKDKPLDSLQALLSVAKDQQVALLEDIKATNNEIHILAEEYETEVIDLARTFQCSTLKRKRSNQRYRVYRPSDKELVDGVHPSKKAKDICFTKIVNVLSREIEKLFHPSTLDETLSSDCFEALDSSVEDSQTSDNDWDFKRRCL